MSTKIIAVLSSIILFAAAVSVAWYIDDRNNQNNLANNNIVVPEPEPPIAEPEPLIVPDQVSALTEQVAETIAERDCIKGGEALKPGTYNKITRTWWFDANLNATRPGCNPACVVSEDTMAAEINWRCTGAIMPSSGSKIANFQECVAAGNPILNSNPAQCVADGETFTEPFAEIMTCSEESRKVGACAQIYEPVCATVEIQCLKAPCEPLKQTFSNACVACLNSLVKTYAAGECK